MVACAASTKGVREGGKDASGIRCHRAAGVRVSGALVAIGCVLSSGSNQGTARARRLARRLGTGHFYAGAGDGRNITLIPR